MAKDTKVVMLKEEVSELKVSLHILKLARLNCKHVCSTFVSVFKWKVLEIETLWDQLIINKGNVSIY